MKRNIVAIIITIFAFLGNAYGMQEKQLEIEVLIINGTKKPITIVPQEVSKRITLDARKKITRKISAAKPLEIYTPMEDYQKLILRLEAHRYSSELSLQSGTESLGYVQGHEKPVVFFQNSEAPQLISSAKYEALKQARKPLSQSNKQ